MQFSRLFWLLSFVMCIAGLGAWLWAGWISRHEETEVKKMSPKTFREFAELSLKNYRQREEGLRKEVKNAGKRSH